MIFFSVNEFTPCYVYKLWIKMSRALYFPTFIDTYNDFSFHNGFRTIKNELKLLFNHLQAIMDSSILAVIDKKWKFTLFFPYVIYEWPDDRDSVRNLLKKVLTVGKRKQMFVYVSTSCLIPIGQFMNGDT